MIDTLDDIDPPYRSGDSDRTNRAVSAATAAELIASIEAGATTTAGDISPAWWRSIDTIIASHGRLVEALKVIRQIGTPVPAQVADNALKAAGEK